MSFIKVATLDQLPENQIVCVQTDVVPLVLIRRGAKVYALENTCSHAAVSFDDGHIEGDTLVCPMHGASFDIASGDALQLPATEAIEVFETRIVDDAIEVNLD